MRPTGRAVAVEAAQLALDATPTGQLDQVTLEQAATRLPVDQARTA